MPQEIDGKGSENLPLCRNRVVYREVNSVGMPAEEHVLSTWRHTKNRRKPSMKHHYSATRAVACTVVPALYAAGFVFADEAITELPPITVSAHNGQSIPYNQTGVSVDVIDVQRMKGEAIYSVSDALTTVPGVYLIPGGGGNQQGNTSQIVIRGMSSDKYTSTMIDGMRLSSNGGDALVTSNILGKTNLLSLSNLELIKGSQGAVYGGGAVGGVVFMETPEGKGAPSITLFNDAGSNSSYTGQLSTQGRKENLAWFISTGYARTDNDVETAKGLRSSERNAFESERWSQAMRVDYYLNHDNTLTATYRREDSEYGYDSMDPWWPSYNNYRFRSNLLTAKWQTQLNKKWAASLMFGYYGFDAKLAADYLQNMRNTQLEWRNSYRWCKHQNTTFSLSWNRNDYDCLSAGTTHNQYRNLENVFGVAVEHMLTPNDAWDISLAARMDYSNVYDALLCLRAASSYRFNDNNTRVFASWGTGYRAPSAFQRSTAVFDYFGYKYAGNPNLNKEKSISADVGVEHALTENHLLSVTFFWSQLSQAIDTLPENNGTLNRYTNMPGHWTALGTEIALSGTIEPQWNTGYKVAWTYVQPKKADDTQIPSTVRQVWQADIYTSPLEGLTTGFGLTGAIGRSHYANSPYSSWDNYYNLRWYAKYKVSEQLQLHIGIENLTNQKFITEGHYMDSNASFISAGTSIHAGCTITF